MIITLPKAVWRTPASWSDRQHFCIWEQLSDITADMRSNGIDADNYDAEQFILIGDSLRGAPRGWYHQSRYSTADGRTLWHEDCALLTSELAILKEASIAEPMPPSPSSDQERAILMRCLANA